MKKSKIETRGRPKLKKSEAKGTFFAARFDEDEAKRLRQAIKASGKNKSDWIREKLLKGTEE